MRTYAVSLPATDILYTASRTIPATFTSGQARSESLFKVMQNTTIGATQTPLFGTWDSGTQVMFAYGAVAQPQYGVTQDFQYDCTRQRLPDLNRFSTSCGLVASESHSW